MYAQIIKQVEQATVSQPQKPDSVTQQSMATQVKETQVTVASSQPGNKEFK